MSEADVERGARALFCHYEGWSIDRIGADSVIYYFTTADPEAKELADDLRAQARVVLAAVAALKTETP